MAAKTDELDLASLRLSAGEGRRLALEVAIEPLELGSESYAAEPALVPLELTVSRMSGGGYALRIAFSAGVGGPCMRCLKHACPLVEVEAREVDRPGGGEELDSPYVVDEKLDLAAWARDAFALALPLQGALPGRLRGALPGLRRRPQRGWSRAPPRVAAGLALGEAERAQARVGGRRAGSLSRRWPSPRKSNRTAAQPSGARTTRSARRR